MHLIKFDVVIFFPPVNINSDKYFARKDFFVSY